MSATKRSSRRGFRQPVLEWEEGAFMYADPLDHIKAGLATLIPGAIWFFTSRPLDEALAAIAFGGYTVFPWIIIFFAGGWAFMSYKLMDRLSQSRSLLKHYGLYAAMGAVALAVVGQLVLAMVGQLGFGDPNPTHLSAFWTYFWGAPVVGAFSSMLGRLALSRLLRWHVQVGQVPPVEALEFVSGKHDKNEFKRL